MIHKIFIIISLLSLFNMLTNGSHNDDDVHCQFMPLSSNEIVRSTFSSAQFCWTKETTGQGITITSGSFVFQAREHSPVWVHNSVSLAIRLLGPEIRVLSTKYSGSVFTAAWSLCTTGTYLIDPQISFFPRNPDSVEFDICARTYELLTKPFLFKIDQWCALQMPAWAVGEAIRLYGLNGARQGSSLGSSFHSTGSEHHDRILSSIDDIVSDAKQLHADNKLEVLETDPTAVRRIVSQLAQGTRDRLASLADARTPLTKKRNTAFSFDELPIDVDLTIFYNNTNNNNNNNNDNNDNNDNNTINDRKRRKKVSTASASIHNFEPQIINTKHSTLDEMLRMYKFLPALDSFSPYNPKLVKDAKLLFKATREVVELRDPDILAFQCTALRAPGKKLCFRGPESKIFYEAVKRRVCHNGAECTALHFSWHESVDFVDKTCTSVALASTSNSWSRNDLKDQYNNLIFVWKDSNPNIKIIILAASGLTSSCLIASREQDIAISSIIEQQPGDNVAFIDAYYGARLLFGGENVLDVPLVRRVVTKEFLHRLCD